MFDAWCYILSSIRATFNSLYQYSFSAPHIFRTIYRKLNEESWRVRGKWTESACHSRGSSAQNSSVAGEFKVWECPIPPPRSKQSGCLSGKMYRLLSEEGRRSSWSIGGIGRAHLCRRSTSANLTVRLGLLDTYDHWAFAQSKVSS
jgi:hypothetical protein